MFVSWDSISNKCRQTINPCTRTFFKMACSVFVALLMKMASNVICSLRLLPYVVTQSSLETSLWALWLPNRVSHQWETMLVLRWMLTGWAWKKFEVPFSMFLNISAFIGKGNYVHMHNGLLQHQRSLQRMHQLTGLQHWWIHSRHGGFRQSQHAAHQMPHKCLWRPMLPLVVLLHLLIRYCEGPWRYWNCPDLFGTAGNWNVR